MVNVSFFLWLAVLAVAAGSPASLVEAESPSIRGWRNNGTGRFDVVTYFGRRNLRYQDKPNFRPVPTLATIHAEATERTE